MGRKDNKDASMKQNWMCVCVCVDLGWRKKELRSRNTKTGP